MTQWSRNTSGRPSTALKEAAKEIRFFAGGKNEERKERAGTQSCRLNRHRTNTTLEELKRNSSKKFNHLDMDRRTAPAACESVAGSDSQFPSRGSIVASGVTLNAMKSVPIEIGKTTFLQDCSLHAGRPCRDLRLKTKMQRLFAYVAFGPARVRQLSVVFNESHNKSFFLAKVWLLSNVEQNRLHIDKKQFTFAGYFETTPPLDNVDKCFDYCLRCAKDNWVDHSFR